MRVFVYEYTCAVADGSLAPSLVAEGRAMLAAVLHDLAGVRGVETRTLLAADVAGEERSHFQRLAAAADYCLVIAPEFEGLLAERCRWVLEAGGRLLGPSPRAVELTADKLTLSHILREHGIPTPACYRADTVPLDPSLRFPAVLKPRDGAGSQATCLVATPSDLGAYLEAMCAEMPRADMVLQAFAHGQPASVAFLIGAGQETALAPATQEVSEDGRFYYRGGTVPLRAELARRAVDLGRRAVRAVPGLRGYVGVDLILGADRAADQVLEINPRLTTSYLGLRALARTNLAAAMLRAARGEPVAEIPWHAGPVRFRADGEIVCGP